MPSSLLALLLYSLVGLPGPAETEWDSQLHPVDGPDADVRILIDDRRVRLAVVLNLAFVDEVVELPRESEGEVHPIEEADANHTLFEYLTEVTQVRIDGVVVQALDAGFYFEPADPSLLPHFLRTGKRGLAKVELLLDYPAKAEPKQVAIVWGSFPPDLVIEDEFGQAPPIEVQARLRALGTDTVLRFSVEAPEYLWERPEGDGSERFLTVPAPPQPSPPRRFPMLSLGVLIGGALATQLFGGARGRRLLMALPLLCGAAFLTRHTGTVELARPDDGSLALTTEEAREVFRSLHTNIYRAFDYVEESDVYDALAQSVEGELLDTLYQDIHQGLVMQDHGGAVSMVKAVTPLETEIGSTELEEASGQLAFGVTHSWRVEGAVFHWGHSHSRTNEYKARYRVSGTPLGWRIHESQVLEARRVDAEPLFVPPARGTTKSRGL